MPTELFSAREGLRDRNATARGSPASAALPGGALAYPTLNGLALVDPRRVVEPELAADEILIDAAWTGERELALAAPLRLSPERAPAAAPLHRARVPQPRIGVVPLPPRRRRPRLGAGGTAARCGLLEPRAGRYRFRLQARLPGREWIEAARQLEVAVTPRIRETTWFRTLALVLGLPVVTALFLWRLRKERELQASHRELRGLASQLIRAQEDERRRLAREIHDDLTQRLAGLGMLAGGLAQAVTQGRAENVGPRVAELGRELERLASDAQVLARELHPSLLENLGLEAAIRSECATFAERTGLRVRFESRAVPERLAPEVSLVLYRIAQEALRNVLSHAGSGDASVALEGRQGALTLTVEDAGAGFDPGGAHGRAGMGLASMAERARLIGSELEIDSAPGRGTRVRVRVGLGKPQRGEEPAADPS